MLVKAEWQKVVVRGLYSGFVRGCVHVKTRRAGKYKPFNPPKKRYSEKRMRVSERGGCVKRGNHYASSPSLLLIYRENDGSKLPSPNSKLRRVSVYLPRFHANIPNIVKCIKSISRCILSLANAREALP